MTKPPTQALLRNFDDENETHPFKTKNVLLNYHVTSVCPQRRVSYWESRFTWQETRQNYFYILGKQLEKLLKRIRKITATVSKYNELRRVFVNHATSGKSNGFRREQNRHTVRGEKVMWVTHTVVFFFLFFCNIIYCVVKCWYRRWGEITKLVITLRTGFSIALNC